MHSASRTMRFTTRFTTRFATRFALALGLALAATTAQAQQANSSTAGFGMGNNYTAAARGYDAVSWNPANLGLKGQQGFTLGIFSVGSSAGIGPIALEDIAEYSGAFIPSTVRQGWIADVRANGTQSGSLDAGATFLAFSVGRFAASVSGSGAGTMTLNGDALELMLLGNADAVAANRTLSPRGSFTGSGFVTSAASFAMPTSWKPTGKENEEFSFGITGKYVLGGAHATAGDNGSSVTPNSIALRFPVVTTAGTDAGSGIGLDLGAVWRGGNTTVGLAVTNVMNTFAWSDDNLTCTNIQADITSADITTNTDEVPCSQIQAQANAVTEQKFKPGLRFGLAYSGKANLLLTADAQMQMGDAPEAIIVGPKSAFGVGAEFSGIPFLPLRAGFSAITGGTQVSAGGGIKIGSYELSVGAQIRSADGVSSTNLMFGLFSIR